MVFPHIIFESLYSHEMHRNMLYVCEPDVYHELIPTSLQGRWWKVFDGAPNHDLPDEEPSDQVMVHVTDAKIKIRITHFSWWTPILSYLFGSETMQMEMFPYMHPPQIRDTDVVHLKVYAVREGQSQVWNL